NVRFANPTLPISPFAGRWAADSWGRTSGHRTKGATALSYGLRYRRLLKDPSYRSAFWVPRHDLKLLPRTWSKRCEKVPACYSVLWRPISRRGADHANRWRPLVQVARPR